MATVSQMLGKFRNVMLNLENIATDIIAGTEQELVALNQNQLFKGQGADGNELPRYRSDRYAKKKEQLNPLPGFGVPDYKLSGNFYNAMSVEFLAGKLSIISSVDYFGDIKARGGDPMGLQPTSKSEYVRSTFNPRFVREISNQTGASLN